MLYDTEDVHSHEICQLELGPTTLFLERRSEHDETEQFDLVVGAMSWQRICRRRCLVALATALPAGSRCPHS